MSDTPIDRETVERLAELAKRRDMGRDNKVADTLLALRAALDEAKAEVRKWQANHDTWRAMTIEAEAALDSAHADVGHNIWRFWRDLARDHLAKRQEAEARADRADRAAQEARAAALQEAASVAKERDAKWMRSTYAIEYHKKRYDVFGVQRCENKFGNILSEDIENAILALIDTPAADALAE